MKATIILLLTIALVSCDQKTDKSEQNTQSLKDRDDRNIKGGTKKEKFQTVNAYEINSLLKDNKESFSAQEVMELFYPKKIQANEGNEKIEVTEKELTNGNVIVTLVHDNLLDDSLRGEKYIMELKKVGDKWRVVSIKKNWKCWEGRGHIDWAIELCK